MPAVGDGDEAGPGVVNSSIGVRAESTADGVGGNAVVAVAVGEIAGAGTLLSDLLGGVRGGDRGAAIGDRVITAVSVVGAVLVAGSVAWVLHAATIRNPPAIVASVRMGAQLNRRFDWGIRGLPAVGSLLTVPSLI